MAQIPPWSTEEFDLLLGSNHLSDNELAQGHPGVPVRPSPSSVMASIAIIGGSTHRCSRA